MAVMRAAVAAIATTLLALSSAAAQNLAGQTRVEMEVPAGAGIRLAANVYDSPGAQRSVAMITTEGEGAEDYRYLAVATDPSTGNLLWTSALPTECTTTSSAYSVVVPLPGGDFVVVAQAIGSVAQGLGTSCVRRLRGTDGSVVWSRSLAAAGTPLYVNELVSDGNGGLLGGGRRGASAYALRLDVDTGATVWERDIAPTTGYYSPRIVAAIAGSSDLAVLQLYEPAVAGDPAQRLIGISTSTGDSRWSQSRCATLGMAYRPSSGETRLRLLADATFEFVNPCLNGTEPRIDFGRIQAMTGAIVWQRELTESNLYRAIIDASGNILLDGALLIDSNEVGISRLDSASGDLQWSLPRPSEPPGLPPYVTNVMVASETFVHVLELRVAVFGYVNSAAIATYSATTGSFLGRFDVDLGGVGSILTNTAGMRMRGVGDLVVTALRAQNLNAGSRLFETRLSASARQQVWSQTHPIMAPRPFVPMDADLSVHQMAWSSALEPGVVIGGSGFNQSNYSFPRVAKVSARDGRVLWRWQTDRGVYGFVSAVLVPPDDNIIVAGSNGWDDPTLLLTKLDGADGHAIWTSMASEPRPALDAVLGSADTIVLVLGHVEGDPGQPIRVAKYSTSDGSQLWSTAIPDGIEGWQGETRVAVSQDGAVFVFASYRDSISGADGKFVGKFRNDDGAMLWLRRLPNSHGDGAIAVQPLANGDALAAEHDVAWRINGATGTVLWEKSFDYRTWSMIADAQGRIYAGGTENGQRAVSRLGPETGAALWTTLMPISNSAGRAELVSKLGFAADGNVLATGGDGKGNDVLARLSSTGAVLWEAVTGHVDSPSGVSGHPVALIEAPDRNLFVGGLGDEGPPTWTVSRVTGSFADGILATGFD